MSVFAFVGFSAMCFHLLFACMCLCGIYIHVYIYEHICILGLLLLIRVRMVVFMGVGVCVCGAFCTLHLFDCTPHWAGMCFHWPFICRRVRTENPQANIRKGHWLFYNCGCNSAALLCACAPTWPGKYFILDVYCIYSSFTVCCRLFFFFKSKAHANKASLN